MTTSVISPQKAPNTPAPVKGDGGGKRSRRDRGMEVVNGRARRDVLFEVATGNDADSGELRLRGRGTMR